MDAEDEDECERIRGEIRIERLRTPTHRVVRFAVGTQHGRGWRLDKYLTAVWPTISRALIVRWLDRGAATIDGAIATARCKLKPGQLVEVHAPLPERDPDAALPPLDILYHDRQVLVCNKPVGQLAHQAGRTMSGTLIDQAADWWVDQGGRREDVRLVNRIDRDTSGIVLLSLDVRAHARMAAAMDAGDLHKEYRAICRGAPTEPAGSWRDPIGELGPHTIARGVRTDGQSAWTDWQRLEIAGLPPAYSLLRLLLHTGRQHQIRVHASHHGLPLVGDWVYGVGCAELPGQALHAAVLALPHPISGRELRIEAPLTPALRELWEQLRAGGHPSPLPLSEEQRSKLGLRAPTSTRRPSWLSADEFARLQAEAGDAGIPTAETAAQPTAATGAAVTAAAARKRSRRARSPSQ